MHMGGAFDAHGRANVAGAWMRRSDCEHSDGDERARHGFLCRAQRRRRCALLKALFVLRVLQHAFLI